MNSVWSSLSHLPAHPSKANKAAKLFFSFCFLADTNSNCRLKCTRRHRLTQLPTLLDSNKPLTNCRRRRHCRRIATGHRLCLSLIRYSIHPILAISLAISQLLPNYICPTKSDKRQQSPAVCRKDDYSRVSGGN